MRVRNFMLARALLLAAGVITTFAVSAADLLGLDPTPGWGPVRRTEFFIGLSLLAASYFLYNRNWQLWFVSRFGFRLNSPGKIAAILFARVILLVAGTASTFLSLTADFFGLVRTPGWNEIRFLHLAGSFLLFVAGVILCLPDWQRWIIRKLGLRWLSPAQLLILLFGTVFLILPGALTTFLVTCGSFGGLSQKVGLGANRPMELTIGLTLLLSGLVFLNRAVQIWFLHRLNLPLATSFQVARALIIRLCIFLLGLSVTILSLFAESFGLDATPGWGWNRITFFGLGLFLLLLAALLASRNLRRKVEHTLHHPDKIPVLL